ncbi:MAG: alpha/beta hydrolase [Rhizobiales bacterium]|nr:alpha/beta hydrolase [Hyphomicrobiales bacterium]
MRNALTRLVLAAALLVPATMVHADGHETAQTAAIKVSEPVPLRPAVKGAPPEQWEKRPTEGDGVRNVVNPALTPFLPAADKANGLAVIVAPGGGFMNLAYDNEGVRVARHLAEQGIAAFVLKYRVNPTPRGDKEYQEFIAKAFAGGADSVKDIKTPREALEDAQAAVRMVRARAQEWGVDPAKVGFIGFSAGAMTALAVGMDEDRAARPDFIAPIYGPRVEAPVPADAPPMFLAIALDDPLFNPAATFQLIEDWQAAGQPVEAHLYEFGGHGFGMTPRSESTRLWMDQFIAWMQDRGLFLDGKAATAMQTGSATIGSLIDNLASRAVLERHMPEFVNSPQVGMARSLSLATLKRFAPDAISDEKLSAINAELMALQDQAE